MSRHDGFNPTGKILGIIWSLVALLIVMQLLLALVKEMWPFLAVGIVATFVYLKLFKRRW